jgi:hypothetical protein
MAESKLQAGGRGWRQPELTDAHRNLMRAVSCVLEASNRARGVLQEQLVALGRLLNDADGAMYELDQSPAWKAPPIPPPDISSGEGGA